MPKDAEKNIRVSEMTRHRIKYLAGSLAMNQGAVIEMVVDKAIQDAKEELDNLAETMLNGDHELILEAQSALSIKMKPAGNT
jgi:hypothetical protein